VGAVGLERLISDDESKTLNGLGINCLRSFPERGILVWGARTVSSDQEWKYVNLRRYLLYLEHSIAQGTQWVVFELNGPPLWACIKSAIENFLMTEWRHGGLLGIKATDAFFVRCDATTMTQTDIDNGQVNCVVGVAVLRPAEFVIFRIGWKIGKVNG
jgi:phage tail sheath protein FI